MRWINWAIGVGLLALFLVIVRRWQIQQQLNQYQHKKGRALKKLRALQRRETEKHVRVLLGSSLALLLVIGLLTGQIIQLETYWQQLSEENTRIKKEITKVKTQQAYYFNAQPLKEYPKEGIDLKNSGWPRLFTKSDSRKAQGQLEQLLAQKLTPYFGQTMAILFIEEKEKQVKLSLQIETELIPELKDNLTSFLAELAAISEVYEVQVTSTEEQQETSLTTYVRAKDKQSFIIQEENAAGK
ncbi:hypothetical protein BAU15_07515 [Enterococcus sp. JM4C]|uniref:hypothetical protein n=1 Tax=Candidatus Enterococcus huntleyi TaxID=1857217 RepID=UPI00137AB5F7|nr:hypothetical protein [Enterococcus sp. JM4C]KAF1297551.1 hypothetical protein BAU15_07515 [Enterococcus sp. JM4C]